MAVPPPPQLRSLGAVPCLALLLLTTASSAGDIERGQRTFNLLCASCHGEDGDATTYADIVPLSGIGRRYPPDVIARLSGAFSGRVLDDDERARVVRYMGTLRSAKGYPDPGSLVSPYLLERKSPRIEEFRILDVRDSQAYAAGHVQNAVHVERGACVETASDTLRWMSGLGIAPSTVVVIYDEMGGPDAACIWWRVRRTGHPFVTLLDGGWRRWTAEQRAVTTVVPRIKADAHAAAHKLDRAALIVGARKWDWRNTIDGGGFRKYEELLRLSDAAGLRDGAPIGVAGGEEQIAHLALVQHLLGRAVDYDARSRTLTCRESKPAPSPSP
jgi:3-mercaptopyruvate sulfurtransferase SseA